MHAQKRIILIKEVIIIKNRVRKFSLFASIILFVVFLIFIIFDFINYDSFENSAPFYTFLRQADGEKNNMNGRMEGLLEMLHLEKRLITPKSAEIFHLELDMEEEFSMAETKLYEMRAESQNYLKNALT